jgi:hypothetical protein
MKSLKNGSNEFYSLSFLHTRSGPGNRNWSNTMQNINTSLTATIMNFPQKTGLLVIVYCLNHCPFGNDVNKRERRAIEMENKQPYHCIICDQVRDEMLPLLDQYICTLCERELARSTVDDLRYGYYVWRLRVFWNHQGKTLYEAP